MNDDSDDDCHVLCKTCAPFDSWDQRDKAYNIFCEGLTAKLNEEGSSMRQEFDGNYPNKELKDLLIFTTHKWRALVLKRSECLALLDNTAHGDYTTYPIDLPDWVRDG